MVIETASPAAFEKGGAYLARFAFATDVTVTAKYEGSTDGMVNVATPDAKGFIPMMELIDRDKELARLNKELTKAEKELGMFTNQLNNPSSSRRPRRSSSRRPAPSWLPPRTRPPRSRRALRRWGKSEGFPPWGEAVTAGD